MKWGWITFTVLMFFFNGIIIVADLMSFLKLDSLILLKMTTLTFFAQKSLNYGKLKANNGSIFNSMLNITIKIRTLYILNIDFV